MRPMNGVVPTSRIVALRHQSRVCRELEYIDDVLAAPVDERRDGSVH
jgi:hypothetical protein